MQLNNLQLRNAGEEMYSWVKDLFPINRSITGQGVRDSLNYFKKIIPELNILSFPSGFKAFDWEVPQEWNIKDAYIKDSDGKKVIDFKVNNLHVVGYSISVDRKIQLNELKKNLHYIKSQPNAIPYVTSYYQKTWGFCISYNQFKNLKDDEYHIYINSTHVNGEMNYGEILIKGKSEKEVLLTSYICHPSMANNELSGPALIIAIVKHLIKKKLNYSYRILLIPETIGSISYISSNLEILKKNVIAGFVITCVGDSNHFSFLPSRMGNSISDKAALHSLNLIDKSFKKYTWFDRGSDERQFCWPGVDLPIASIMRSKYGTYDEYHTSLDDLNFISPEGLSGSMEAYLLTISFIEENKKLKSLVLCEPKLDKRGLYSTLSKKNLNSSSKTILDFMSLCDGLKDIFEISDLLKKPIQDIIEIKNLLVELELIIEID